MCQLIPNITSVWDELGKQKEKIDCKQKKPNDENSLNLKKEICLSEKPEPAVVQKIIPTN